MHRQLLSLSLASALLLSSVAAFAQDVSPVINYGGGAPGTGGGGGGTGNVTISPATGNTAGDAVVMSNTTTTVVDAGYAPAKQGIGAVITSNPTLTAAQFNTQCPTYTVNANSLNIALPAASTLQANGGCALVSNPSAFLVTVTPNGTDTLNGVNAALTLPPNTFSIVTSDSGVADFMPVPVSLSVSQDWDGVQSNKFKALTPSGSNITPDCSRNNYSVTFVHANTPFTLVNPSCTLKAGSAGIIDFKQSSTGGDSITTWGSTYIYVGGTSAITFSSGANQIDTYAYVMREDGSILLSQVGLNATH